MPSWHFSARNRLLDHGEEPIKLSASIGKIMAFFLPLLAVLTRFCLHLNKSVRQIMVSYGFA
jgi:hypothetical protein